jgi:hypothetical protein
LPLKITELIFGGKCGKSALNVNVKLFAAEAPWIWLSHIWLPLAAETVFFLLFTTSENPEAVGLG